MASNGNRQWTIWVAGILSSIILTALTMTIKSVIANDVNSRERDEKIEIRVTDKLDKNQKEIREELANLNNKQSVITSNQSELMANQKWVMEILKEIKTKIQ